jgi:hypothetical protein
MTSTEYGLLQLHSRVTRRATGNVLLESPSKIHFSRTPFSNTHYSVALIQQTLSSLLHAIRTSMISRTLSYFSIGFLEISNKRFREIPSVIHLAIEMMVFLAEGSCLQCPLRVRRLDSSPAETQMYTAPLPVEDFLVAQMVLDGFLRATQLLL